MKKDGSGNHMLSEIIQNQKDKYNTFSLMWNLGLKINVNSKKGDCLGRVTSVMGEAEIDNGDEYAGKTLYVCMKIK
jgi:hypothetical protein